MSGHSKWAQIKRQKGANDHKRGQTFTKLANAITIAAREKGGDPEMNFVLRLAIDRAKQANMPKENIERAVKRGTGELNGARIEEIIYEGYGPEGVALIIVAQTDNKNRALQDIKTALSRHGGKLASAGSVRYLFRPIGRVLLPMRNFDEQFERALEAGADDVYTEDAMDEHFVVIETQPMDLAKVRQGLAEQGEEILEAELTEKPTTTTVLSAEGSAQLERLLVALDDSDDVSQVLHNAAEEGF